MIKYPNIYKIAANEDFFWCLAKGIIYKTQTMCNLKDVTILLPTQHACHSLKATFIRLTKTIPLAECTTKHLDTRATDSYIPKIHSITDLNALVKTSTSYLARIALVNKVSNIIIAMKLARFNNPVSITELAEYFVDLLYQAELYQINLNKFIEIINQDSTMYQQELYQILINFLRIWENTQKSLSTQDTDQSDRFIFTKAGYNNLLIESLNSNKPLFIAGINSNIPSVVDLMTRASEIIIYGLDEHLTDSDWEKVDLTHSQYHHKNLFNRLNITAKDVKTWPFCNKRNSIFISEALKPAKACNHWHKHSITNDNIEAFTCLDLYHEAKTIIDIITQYNNAKIMIVTNDDALMIKLILHLKANNLNANIIRDYPLAQTQTAIWLKLCLNFILEKYSLLSALALLKHPFAAIDSQTLIQLELLIRDKNFYSDNIFDAQIEHDFLTTLSQASADFKHLGFNSILKAHINFAESLANQDIWEKQEELKTYLMQLLEHCEAFNDITFRDYPALFHHFMRSAYFREAPNAENNITLCKPIDARLHSADVVILAGLNETIWPAQPKNDPCFNSKMLMQIGLPPLEQSIGEEAYDFQCLAQAEKVILTRSDKINGIITTPSRWFSRILTLSRKTPVFLNMKTHHRTNTRQEVKIYPALEYRPTKLSVTQIEKLIFNPYHIYVDTILKLKKLPALNKELSSLDFGNFIHKALEFQHYDKSSLLEAGKKALTWLGLNQPQIQLIWWPRFIRIAEWLTIQSNRAQRVYVEESGMIKIHDNFILIAKADRIEISSNLISIIDYKTGKLATSASIYNGTSLQLLLEGIIADASGFNCQIATRKLDANLRDDRAKCIKTDRYILQALQYMQLSGGEEPVTTLNIDITEKPILEQTKKYIHQLIAEYQNPAIPYHYTTKKLLGYCPYAHLARIFD